MTTKATTIPLLSVQIRLAIWWGIGLLCCTVLLIVQTVNGVYDGADQRIWQWYLPQVSPASLLIYGWLLSRLFANQDDRVANRLASNGVTAICLVYIFVVFGCIVGFGVSGSGASGAQQTTLFLPFLHSFAAAGLGALFTSSPPPSLKRTPVGPGDKAVETGD